MFALKTALVALSLAAASPALANGVIYLPDMKFPSETKSEVVTKNAGSVKTTTSVSQDK